MTSVAQKSALLSAVTVALLAFLGAWERRWMSDDGLIVLRTVRNILAGNGPVFNAGERVEANTSTLWQYLIALVGWVLPEVRLESIALWLALLFSTAALGVATWATTGLWRHRTGVLLLPLGGLIYIALPPARDFATSGLEWGLSIFWIAVLWLLLVRWVRRTGGALPLAFWAGMSWLIRPELALYGGLVGLLLLLAAGSWRARAAILAVALPLPAAYQLFRMGYYGLLVPHTAVAKSASGAQWGSGWEYLLDLASPYWLWLPLLLALVAGVLVSRSIDDAASADPTQGVLAGLRRPAVAVLLVELAALLHLLYVIRVGGDFMHGRMLLLPLFTLLLPVAVLPVALADAEGLTRWRRYAPAFAWCAVAGWAALVTLGVHGHKWEPPSDLGELSVVDEREFWTWNTGRESGDAPMFAQDFLAVPLVADYREQIAVGLEENAAMLLSVRAEPTFTPVEGQRADLDGVLYTWLPVERGFTGPDLANTPLTVSMLNLGVTGMNAPLDVRVLDPMGLANPLAARQPRIEGGRIGHDKLLPTEWQIADSAMNLGVPLHWIDQEQAVLARNALYTEDVVEMFETYRAPLDPQRVLSNIKFSLTLGRTLELDPDPTTYFDDPHVDPAVYPIAWPIDVHLDTPR
ncbi:hypothetical protein NQ015_07100 [Corynebacterium sp. 153RC1]|uniref:flagellar motor control protein ZomB n=1 Tax=unclassified Corynebacterium TaxID=2624378 RepID=UPI00211C6B43|nr:hypothetical protein [Corynebacterium sp. 209RC1]MCQ9354882.1 hypothetical protein [Corynebacterium sp. 1222RC1]MCQ9357067.1 hypothetical protein [Corynebacterium sp. 122RC1]MCQ9359313.1 hypothetical protein [Corynebacterium sp. 142RC1]MCQ9361535.1 hypothetical protein [Corynebacterium sp. 153RC1]MCQ9363660.1 hypothetical protein [Corynebacterium sp. 732RC1]MCQ9365455.1 hypothetical protein [Corynebacterium sp. 70RC1]